MQLDITQGITDYCGTEANALESAESFAERTGDKYCVIDLGYRPDDLKYMVVPFQMLIDLNSPLDSEILHITTSGKFTGYTQLGRVPARFYLQPDLFILEGDSGRDAYCCEQYNKGLEKGKASRYIYLSYGGVWGAAGKDNSHTSSYEGIGYHGGTAALLEGFIASGCPIKVFRHSPLPRETWINGGPVDGSMTDYAPG